MVEVADLKLRSVGGIPRKTYYTPDGREVKAIPAMRTFQVKKEGKVVETGIRDANLDNGWLDSKPQNPKPYCPHCDKWHDTQEEVEECGEKKRAFNEKWEKKAAQLKHEGGDIEERVDKLESGIEDIKSLLTQLIKEK